MAHYDGPAFNRDGNTLDAKEAQPQKVADKPVTYHSVDPMAQFVTPPSVASRTAKTRTIDYRSLTATMRRADDDVIVLASAAEVVDDAPITESEESVVLETPVAPVGDATAAEVDSQQPSTTAVTASAVTASPKRPELTVPEEDEWWPVEVEKTLPVLRDDSPDSQQHHLSSSALTPKVTPLPSWLETHRALEAYMQKKH